MQKIKWIHFSDLHLGNDMAVDTRLMRRKLPQYIAGLNQTFDYAFCTGDVKEWNTGYSEAPDYLRSLCISSKTPMDHLFIVPGNHDVNIDRDDRTEVIRRLTNWQTDDYKSNVGIISETDLSILKSGEEKFISFISDLLGPERADKYEQLHFVIATEHFNIVHLDSTITYGKGHERDFIVGMCALMDVLDACDASKPIIILTHYSFDFLSQDERNQVETLLAFYNVQLWFAGHEHENLIRWQREKFLECQSGNLALQKGARSCFLEGDLDLDTGDGMIRVHAWYEGKGWEEYPFARVGSEDDRIFPFQLRLPGDKRATGVSVELSNAREAYDSLSSAGGIFDGVKLNTAILTDLDCNGKLIINKGSPYPLAQVMETLWMDKRNHPELSCNALILGDGGLGKSTMMYHECGELLSNRHLAVYISLQAREGANNETIFDYTLRCLYKSTDKRARDKFVRLTASAHTYPDLVLFIDGFNELSGVGAQRYAAEIKAFSQYPGVQIIISSRMDFLRDYGLSYFNMIRTCGLREEQIKRLFDARPNDWRNVEAQKNLLILLKNPMMALLYASTCPILEKHADLDYLKWIKPISNASDLLRDYYLSQIAILLERDAVDGNCIFDSMVVIDCVLPALAYLMERRNIMSWKESEFESELRDAVSEVNNRCFGDSMPESLRRIRRTFRVHTNNVNLESVYDLIISEMVLLKFGNGIVSFAHQIFRDYLAAVYLHNCLLDNISVERLWHDEEIHKGVVQYLRYLGNESTWGTDGKISQLLLPYRGKEAAADDWFVPNVINCWLSVGDGERDLSNLDLRRVSLSDHLKVQFTGTINIDNAWISKETLINDRHHDRIVGICFSHDNRTMAAISINGLVSITNLLTQSQMIVGQLRPSKNIIIGFDADDYLIVKNGHGTYKWSTIAYDKIEEGNAEEIIVLSVADDKKIAALEKRLKESDLYGVCRKASENGRYLAVGYESGFIQVWDVYTQDCIANLSLSDSQIATVAFTKDGKFAALGSGGKLIQVWDMDRGKCTGTLYFPQRISRVKLPAEGNTLECQFSDGTFCKVNLKTGVMGEMNRPSTKPFVSKSLLKYIESMKARNIQPMKVKDIQSTSKGNAIVLTERGEAFTWDEKQKKLKYCPGHNSQVTAIAVCSADERFAASYSPEKYHSDRNDGKRRDLLDNQKLVRVRIISTGQCQWRLPTKGRSIMKLQFFTSNRIILAGYASNGDILLWELINEQKYGREIGHWESVEIVRNNQAEPLECAFPEKKKTFISAYADGTILIRPFSNSNDKRIIATIPGIDVGVFRWKHLKCDESLLKMLEGYPHEE